MKAPTRTSTSMYHKRRYFKRHILKLRTTLGVSQRDMAYMLDVAVPTISRWENGRYAPSLHLYAKLDELCKQAGMKVP